MLPIKTLAELIRQLFLALEELLIYNLWILSRHKSKPGDCNSNLDNKNNSIYEDSKDKLISYLCEYVKKIETEKQHLQILLHLERLGDYAQNVYEWIVYLAISKLKENFVANNTPWIRLDIAGIAYLSKPEGYLPKGATGIHVKTLYNLINK